MNGQYVVSAGMDHAIKVWDISGDDVKYIIEKSYKHSRRSNEYVGIAQPLTYNGVYYNNYWFIYCIMECFRVYLCNTDTDGQFMKFSQLMISILRNVSA